MQGSNSPNAVLLCKQEFEGTESRRQRRVLGLNHEAILYDPEALVEPLRIIRNIVKLSGF